MGAFSLRKALYLAMFLVILPGSALLLYSGWESRNSMRQEALQRFDFRLNEGAAAVGTVVSGARTMLQYTAQLGGVVRNERPRSTLLFQSLMAQKSVYSNLILADARGVPVASARPLLRLEGQDAFRSNLIGSGPVHSPEQARELAVINELVRHSALYLGALVRDARSGELTVPMAVLVEDDEHNQTGSLVAYLNAAEVGRFADSFDLASAYRLRLFDSVGRLLYDGGPYEAAQAAWGYIGGRPEERLPGLGQWSQSIMPWTEVLASGESSRIHTRQAWGGTVLVSYRSIYAADNKEPLFVAELSAPASNVFAAADGQIPRYLALIGLAMLISFAIVRFLGSGALIEPGLRLQRLVGALADGDLKARAAMRGFSGELGRLAQAFDSMAEGLERRNAQLLQAKWEADEANKAKGDFLGNMSHGIRTPMNSIIGMTYLAMRTPLTDKQRGYLSKIYGAANSLLGIINDILDFSRIEAGQMSIENVKFSIDEVMETTVSLVRQRAEEKGLELIHGLSPDVPEELMGDPIRLGQVLLNLVNNAVKFTENGQIYIFGRGLGRSGNSYSVEFTVRDTGIGMSDEQKSRLFQAFTQADGSITRKFGGTGLGLTITKKLLELMGGSISLESELNQGTEVLFKVDFALPENLIFPKYPPEGGEAAQLDYTAFIGQRALVVDNNKDAGEIIRTRLEYLGFEVSLALSSSAAFSTLKKDDHESPYRLCFIRYSMRDISGPDATRHILRGLGLAHPPVVILTTFHNQEDIYPQAKDAGAAAVLYHPERGQRMHKLLSGLLSGKGDSGALGGGEGGGEAFGPRSGQDAQALLPRGLRILLVEDDPVNQQVAVELLEEVGAYVTVATNGVEALSKLNLRYQEAGTPGFDLVLMDVQMPEMDGYEATRRIRSDLRFEKLPVLAMTARALLEEREQSFAAGMNDHISKPLEVNKFYETMARWVRKAHKGVDLKGKIEHNPGNGAFSAAHAASSVRGGAASALGGGSPAHGKDPAGPGLWSGADHSKEGQRMTQTQASTEKTPELPGFDVSGALKRLNNSVKLYNKMLGRFLEHYASGRQDYQAALGGQDPDEPQRIAHTIKGLAASIGAMELSEAARVLELAHKDGAPAAEAAENCFNLLDQACAVIRCGLEALEAPAAACPPPVSSASSAGPSAAPGAVADAASREKLEELRSLLDDDDADAVECFQSGREAYAAILGAEGLAALEKALEQYDFAQALAVLNRFKP